jgi:hypothetical protein
MQDYSCWQLSDPMDKLPAVSSIASYFSHRTKYQYAAGLWIRRGSAAGNLLIAGTISDIFLRGFCWVVQRPQLSNSRHPGVAPP